MCHCRHTTCEIYLPPIATYWSRFSRPVPPPLAHPMNSSGPTPWYSPFVTSTTTPAAATCGTRQSTVPTPLHAPPSPPTTAAPTAATPPQPTTDAPTPATVHRDKASPIGTYANIMPLRASTTW